ncbi:MAG: DUF4339 domain-containing protein, partial [Planctomycetaceae bacterium]
MSPQSPASPPDPGSPPGVHRWYYRVEGGVSGPVSTEQMLRDARSGQLTLQTEVRLGSAGDWVLASTLEGLLPEAPANPDDRPPSGPGGAIPPRSELSRLVAECRVYLQEREAGRVCHPPSYGIPHHRPAGSFVGGMVRRLSSGFAAAGQAAAVVVEMLFGMLAGMLPSFSTVRRVVRSRLLWGIFAVCALVTIGAFTYEAATRQQRQAASLSQLALELRALRAASADDAAWTQFGLRVRRHLDELIPELEQAARAGDRASIDLLWAARDYLPRMLT